MTPTYDKIHLKFKLNSKYYDKKTLIEVAYSLVKEGRAYEKAIGDFLIDWLDSKSFIKVKTSGSTGAPKVMHVSKQSMVNSSIATGDYFKMKPGQRALHCLPSHYISGKMMLVRALILGLELDCVEPSSKPEFDTSKHYDFCAMVPLQLQNSIADISNIKILIVGGASVSKPLEEAIQSLETKVYATFGMTETVSHIAVKRLNGTSRMKYFKVFPKVKISQDDRGCLLIDAPHLSTEKVITNDHVVLHSETDFEMTGRYDNMINSGGVKLFPETIESKLETQIPRRFFISSQVHETLGEEVILIVEGKSFDINQFDFLGLEKFEHPKTVYFVPHFVETNTGKIQRLHTKALVL